MTKNFISDHKWLNVPKCDQRPNLSKQIAKNQEGLNTNKSDQNWSQPTKKSWTKYHQKRPNLTRNDQNLSKLPDQKQQIQLNQVTPEPNWSRWTKNNQKLLFSKGTKTNKIWP